jgi:hypothetical protein
MFNLMKAPMPNPALKSLARLLGAWRVLGEANGQVTFKWMEGGFFMVQDINLADIKGIEFIGYEENTGKLLSHYFDSNGSYLEYTYQVSETAYIVSVDMPGIKGRFTGNFSNNGNVISGEWKWIKDGSEWRYPVILTRVTRMI